ncbi:MAG: DMT family transporter [Patescibacteria group bacterium]
MSWIFFAVLAYFLTAFVFILDKIILSRAITKPVLFAFYAGLLSIYGLFLAPFGFSWSLISWPVLILSLSSGFIFIMALILFYRAEQLGDVSRVAPLVGAITAVFILGLSNLFSVEKLTSLSLAAFFFLVLGVFLLSFSRSNLNHFFKVMFFSLSAALLFAVSFILIKLSFLKTGFINAYILGRLGEFLAALFLISLASVRNDLFNHLKQIEAKSIGLFLTNKILAASSFLLLNYAIFLGNVSLAQALIGLQYVFLLIFSGLLSWRLPQILGGDSGRTVFKKIAAIFCVFLGLFILYLDQDKSLFPGVKSYGATFSYSWAEKLGLNPKEAYLAVLDDLKSRNLRLPLYWDEIEKQPGKYYFENIDWQINEAEKRGAKIIAAIGFKLPRWPECHIPFWLAERPKDEFKIFLLDYIEKTVTRVGASPAIWAWQVENEPFLKFGQCPELDEDLLDQEISLVRSLDSRPVIVTDSGELSFWVSAAKKSDILGTTIYRTVWDKRIPLGGYLKYPLPPAFFHLKANAVNFLVKIKKIIVVEFQAEPWGPRQLYESSLEEQFRFLDFEQFKENLVYAQKVGFPEVYFWGAEWWYWLKEKQNHPEFWNEAKNLFSNQ